MELRQLRYFVTVAETLHFGRAAELLHIVQPAVSQQIQRLERELGAALFDRSPRRVRLTAFGEGFLPAARAVLTAEQQAHAVAAQLIHPQQRVLRLGTSSGLGDHLDRIMDRLVERAPELLVELVSAPVQERLRQVAEGRLDAAFVRGSGSGDRTLRTVPVWQDPLMVALPARHPLAAAEAVAPAELAGLALALTSRRNHPALVDLVVGACAAAGFDPLPGPSDGTLQDTLAAIGSGRPLWTVVYASHARQLRGGRVAFRPFAVEGMELTTSLVIRDSAPPAELDLLLAACCDLPTADLTTADLPTANLTSDDNDR